MKTTEGVVGAKGFKSGRLGSSREAFSKNSRIKIKGIAWSGLGSIHHVEVSFDGNSWADTEISIPETKYEPTHWTFTFEFINLGNQKIMVRATDENGNTQPMEPVWNTHGYGNNFVHKISVEVID